LIGCASAVATGNGLRRCRIKQIGGQRLRTVTAGFADKFVLGGTPCDCGLIGRLAPGVDRLNGQVRPLRSDGSLNIKPSRCNGLKAGTRGALHHHRFGKIHHRPPGLRTSFVTIVNWSAVNPTRPG
jgi:hypothetical protein